MMDNSLLSLCLTFFAAIFAITNPLGALPIFMSMTSHLYTRDRNRVALITAISISIIVVVSLLLGSYILAFFGVTLDAFRIAGGLMIASMAFPMLKGGVGEQKQNKEEKQELAENTKNTNATTFQASSIAIVPLAMPLMAGPGTISTAILWATKITTVWDFIGIIITLCIYSTLIFVLFLLSPLINRMLGVTGSNVITRIMGLFMLSLGVQFVISAIINILKVNGVI